MNKFINILWLTLALSAGIFAQTQNTDEYRKNEFYGGYSHLQADNDGRQPSHGFEGAYVRNVHRYFGIKADVSATFRNDTFNLTSSDQTNGTYSFRGEYRSSIYNVLGGVQIKDNASKARFKPFAHALAGLSVNRYKNSPPTCTAGTCPAFITSAPGATFNDKGFGLALGGGLDIKINDRIDFRAIQVDYNPIFGNSRTQNNIRFGVGFVFK